MASNGRRGWRPPANAQTFSFGPFLTCHCAHGVADDGEVAIDREEIRRGSPRKQGSNQGSKSDLAGPSRLQSRASQSDKAKVQLPASALPELQAREARMQQPLPLRDPSMVSLSASVGSQGKQSALKAPTERGSPSKVWTILLSIWVCTGLAALAAGYPSAEEVYNTLEDRLCKLQSAQFRSVSEDDGLDRYNLSPSMTCRVHLELYTGKSGCQPKDPDPRCWAAAPSLDGGWSKVNFQFPKEFLRPGSRETCHSLVDRYVARPEGFPCSVVLFEDHAVAIAEGRQALSPLRLVLLRRPLTVILWLTVAVLLCLGRICGGPKTFCLASRMRRLFKASAIVTALLFGVAAAALAWRYQAAKEVISRLEDGSCSLHSSITKVLASDWPMEQVLVCQANLSIEGADSTSSSVAFTAPWRWRNLASPMSQQCTDLVSQAYDQGSFACAFESVAGGNVVFAGRKDALSPLLVDGVLLSMHRSSYATWWWCTLSSLALLLVATPATLLSCVRWRREVTVDGYRALPGR